MGKTVDFDECRLEMEKPFSAVNLSEDTDDDSDQRQLFELPRRKVIRPTTSSFKKKLGNSRRSCCSKTGLCCKVCFSTLVPIFAATFVAFTLIFFIVLMMGISGINKELEGLKVRVSYAEGAEKDFNAKRDKLRKDYEEKLTQLKKEQKNVKTYQNQIQSLQKQIKFLNSSLQEIRKHPALDVVAVKSDLDKLKTGMADTGSSISKLENTHNSLEKRVSSVETESTKFKDDLYNITVKISEIQRKPPPPPRVTTPKTLVITLTPDENTPVKLKDFKKALRQLDEKQEQICNGQSALLMKEIIQLRNETLLLNETYFNKFTILNQKFHSPSSKKKPSTLPPATGTIATRILPPVNITSNSTTNVSTNSLSAATEARTTVVTQLGTTRPPITTATIHTRKDSSKSMDDLDSLSKNFHRDTTDNLLDKRDILHVLDDMHRKKRWEQTRDLYNDDDFSDYEDDYD